MPSIVPANTKYVVGGRVMGGTIFRKVAKRTRLLPEAILSIYFLAAAVAAAAETPALPAAAETLALPTAAETPALPTAAETPALPAEAETLALPPLEENEEDRPAAKKPRLQAPNRVSTAAHSGAVVHDVHAHKHTPARATEGVTTDDIPTDNVPTNPVTPAAASLPITVYVTSRVARRNWEPEEDANLTKAVEKQGKKWGPVAAMVPGRTDQQCYSRWTQTLYPITERTVGRWKLEEDAKLTDAVEKHGKNWLVVAEMVHGRTNQQCRTRYMHTLDPSKTTYRWKPEEDAKLTDAVKKYGKDWVAAAAMISGRTNQQCSSRYTQIMDRANNVVRDLLVLWIKILPLVSFGGSQKKIQS
jgi:hypothetical protein